MNRSTLATAPLLLSLSACLTGGNVKGDFQCQAPGGTCAPMSSIDASAVASIGSFRSVSDPAVNGPALPRPLTGPVLADGTAPPRTTDRVLRVVFPAHVDGEGIYREESAAHAVVESAAWAEALGAQPRSTRGVPPLRPAGIVPTAASGSALATMDEIVASRAAGAKGAEAAVASPSEPGPAIVSQAAPVAASISTAASFQTGSRSTAPMSLAEAAAGLAAPKVTALDPATPTSYDTPDVLAARAQPARPAAAPIRAPAATELAAAATANAGSGSAAPYGTRPVRWKGRTYQLPYKSPQPTASATRPTPPTRSTAELNEAALAKASVAAAPAKPAEAPPLTASAPLVPSYGPTSDAREAQERVKAMAAPVLLGAMEQGRDAARKAARNGFALPLTKVTPQ